MFFFKGLKVLRALKALGPPRFFNFSAPTFCILIIMCIFARLTNAKSMSIRWL